MYIGGLQKLAMVDYPGKLAATVFTGGCNLRCPFCHNALLVTRLRETPALEEKAVLDFRPQQNGGKQKAAPFLPSFLRFVRRS